MPIEEAKCRSLTPDMSKGFTAGPDAGNRSAYTEFSLAGRSRYWKKTDTDLTAINTARHELSRLVKPHETEEFDMAGDLRTLTQPLGRMIRWHDAPDPFASLRGDMEDLFGRYFRPVVTNGEAGQMLVAVDVDETENAYVFTLDVPGVKRDEIHVDFEGGRLSISGQRVRESREETASSHRSQRSFGSFTTSFALPGEVNSDKIDAKLTDGVLTVTVPKSDDAKKKVKKITVKAT